MGDLGSILGMGRSAGEGKGYPLQDYGLENSMDYTVLGVLQELDMTERLSLSGFKTATLFHESLSYNVLIADQI